MQSVLRRWPLLDCRTPLVNYTGLILPDDPDAQAEALATIAQAGQAIGQEHHASFVLLDYLNPQFNALRPPDGFQTIDIGDPATLLDVQWADFDSYLGQMSKSMRKDYHRHCNRAGDLQIDVQIHPCVTRAAEALPLIRQVERHHGSAPDPYIAGVLEHSALVDARWLTAEVDHRLVGCGLLLGDRGGWTLTALGLDYSVRFVYFQLLYAAIRAVIDMQARFLYGGSGANDLKQRLGFTLLHNNYLAVAANQWIFRQITQRLA